MEHLLKLPNCLCKGLLWQYLTVQDVVKLDNACTNKKYRQKLLKKLKNVILIGDCDEPITITLFEWMGRRSIYLSNVHIDQDFARWRNRIRSSNKDQFKFAVKNLKCYSLEDTHINILLEISLFNPGVISLELRRCNLSDATVIAITQHCTGLQSFCDMHCDGITDISISSLVRHCPALKELHLSECFNLSNTSLLLIAKHCPGLQVLDLGECMINDIGIIALTRNCKGLKSLNLACSCRGLTDTGVLSIQENCPELQELFLCYSEFISLEVMNSQYFRSKGAFRYVGVKGLLPQYQGDDDEGGDEDEDDDNEDDDDA